MKKKKLLIALYFLDDTFEVSTGDKLATSQMSVFAVGAGGFGGPRNSPHVIPCVDPPKRKPCASVTQKTSRDQVSIQFLRLCSYNTLNSVK